MEDNVIQSKLDKLGQLDERMTSVGSPSMPGLSDSLTKQFTTLLSKFSKLLPEKVKMSVDAAPYIQQAIDSAIQAGILDQSYSVPPIESDREMYLLIGTMDTLLKDKGLARDLKDFWQSNEESVEESSLDNEEPSQDNIPMDNRARLSKLISNKY